MNHRAAANLVDKIERAHALAVKAYQRYSWSPGTSTGQKHLERFEHHDRHLREYCADLREMLEGPQ